MRKLEDVVVVSGVRTPIGRYGGALRDMRVHDLGALTVAEALRRAPIEPQMVDEVILGHCRQSGNGPNPARTVAVKAGIPVGVPAVSLNMACPSGMKAIITAAHQIRLGEAEVVVAGGMESMSTIPYLLMDSRWEPLGSGHKTLLDEWVAAVDPVCGLSMGQTAERLVQRYGISRRAQDEFALESHRKAAMAWDEGLYSEEIIPVTSRSGKTLARDESIRTDTNLEQLAHLRPVFAEHGRVTAGNACPLADGACAIVLASRDKAKELGLRPLCSLVSHATVAVEPATMGEGPQAAIPAALRRSGMPLDEMDYIEVNEAFAVQILANESVLQWDRSRLNVWGGALALGHPTGMSGARIVLTLANVLRRNGARHGVASLCGGGGVSCALVIRNEA